ncbi:unnamed protein product, partial [Coregonus sp. 'balchen']
MSHTDPPPRWRNSPRRGQPVAVLRGRWQRSLRPLQPGIYKGDYLKELFRYGDTEDVPAAPSLPEWCFDDDDQDDDGNVIGQESSQSGPSSSGSALGKRRKERIKVVLSLCPWTGGTFAFWNRIPIRSAGMLMGY